MPSTARPAKPTTINDGGNRNSAGAFPAVDIRTADGIIEFYKRELSFDGHGKSFCYENLMPNERIKRHVNIGKIRLVIGNPLLTTPKIKKDIIPILKDIYRQNTGDYELFNEIIKAYIAIKDHFGGKNTSKWILPCLLGFLESEESEVRNTALSGIRDIVEELTSSEVNKLYMDVIQLALRSLTKSSAFQGRQSSALLIGMVFHHGNDTLKSEMREFLTLLIYDETVMVQYRTAETLLAIVSHPNVTMSDLTPTVPLPEVTPNSDDASFVNAAIFLPFTNTLHSKQRCLLLHVIQALTAKMSKNANVSPIIKHFEDALLDPSQNVRLELAKLIPLFLESFHHLGPHMITELVLPSCLQMIEDPCSEVREQILRSIYTCLHPRDEAPSLVYLHSMNYIQPVLYDDVMTHRLSEANAVVLLPNIIKAYHSEESGKLGCKLIITKMMSRLCNTLPIDIVEDQLLPLLMGILVNSEDMSEQTEAARHCVAFYKKLKITDLNHQLVATILPVLTESTALSIKCPSTANMMTLSSNWRFRCAVCSNITALAKILDPSNQEDLLAHLFGFMKDEIFSVREAAYETCAELCTVFGDQFFYKHALEQMVIYYRVFEERNAKVPIAAWKHVCNLIEHVAPRLTTYKDVLCTLLLKFNGEEDMIAIRMAAINAANAILRNSSCSKAFKGSSVVEALLLRSPGFCSEHSIHCDEISIDIKQAADKLYTIYRSL